MERREITDAGEEFYKEVGYIVDGQTSEEDSYSRIIEISRKISNPVL
jgi:hypothetical protein